MTARPTVSVYDAESDKIDGSSNMPAVFSAPIRDDLVSFCHSNMALNRRQAHAVYYLAGHEHSAESWGTGRAVARIPRISGSGTHRSGQGAFGNMCRKGRMFAPLKVWRKWQRKVNTKQKRNAVASALAASACAPLVQARGHRIETVPELPLVVSNLNGSTTSGLLGNLKNLGAMDDLTRVRKSKRTRAGIGKMKNTRFTLRKGPLVIYGDESPMVKRAARNLPGVEVCNVNRINLLQLAPGGHLGRFIIFTKDAFESLDKIFGSYTTASEVKSGWTLGRNMMTCADLARIINSDQVQSKIRQVRTTGRVHDKTKKNPLKNKTMMQKLNPFASKARELEDKAQANRVEARKKAIAKKESKAGQQAKAKRTVRFNKLSEDLEQSFKDAQKVVDDERKAGEYKLDESSDEEEEDDE